LLCRALDTPRVTRWTDAGLALAEAERIEQAGTGLAFKNRRVHMRSISSIRRRRPSASMVIALVALFAALGGTGYAAAMINGRDIQKRSIPGNRVVNDGLTGKQVNESKLGTVPLAQQALTAQTAASATTAAQATNADHARSADSATSAQDSLKLQGRDATRFLANSVRVVLNETGPIADNTGAGVSVSCNAGEKAIGGGAAWIISGNAVTELNAPLTASLPLPATPGTDHMTGWQAHGRNLSGVNRSLRVYAICVPKSA